MKNRLFFRWILVTAFAAAATVGFVREWADTAPRFVRPYGWPKPHYDFSKNKQTEAGVTLGRALFYDPVLSRDSTISCASCHLQYTGFTHVDHAVSHGIEGRKGTRNAPVLIDLAWNTAFHWDGGVNNLEVQAINPIEHPAEMDNSLANAVARLNRSPRYKEAFAAAFGKGEITSQRMLKALAQFTVSLVSYQAKYDKYTRHEAGGEMTPQEINGLRLFRAHCAACHQEPLFTNNAFANNGLPIDADYNDLGRYHITLNPADSSVFKVPTLRNIEHTYPYMHDGRFKKLKEVLNHYAGGGIHPSTTLAPALRTPMLLSPEEKKDVIAFLLTLTDKEFLYNKRFMPR